MATILIVDDDPLMYELYELMLSQDKHTVFVANNGEQALKLAEEKKPDLILLDVMMPKMNGLDVLEHLKQNPETQDCLVIAFSNLVDPTVEKAALDKGAVRYAVKSQYQSKALRHLVEEVLDTKTASRVQSE